MSGRDYLFLVGLILVAVFILYRAVKKKSWCPDIYGNGKGCSTNSEENKKQQ
jgi:hypothetical protein